MDDGTTSAAWSDISVEDARALIAATGKTWETVAIGRDAGATIVSAEYCTMRRDGDQVAINAGLEVRYDDGETIFTERGVEIRDGVARICMINGRELGMAPYNEAPVELWRIQDERGIGPLMSGVRGLTDVIRDMNHALTGDADTLWHNQTMPAPADEGLNAFAFTRCAATSPRQLVRWFPRPARRALARHGFRVVRLRADVDTAQIGTTQAVFDPRYATLLDERPLAA